MLPKKYQSILDACFFFFAFLQVSASLSERTLSMKLPEFRKQIETYSIEELRYLTAELYKAIPKKIKEEKDIDPLVLSVPEHFKAKKRCYKTRENILLAFLSFGGRKQKNCEKQTLKETDHK